MITQAIILGLVLYQYFTVERPLRIKSAIMALMLRDAFFLILTVTGRFQLCF